MDLLDSLDLETTHKRSHRVRSWYLYEQFKSQEKNQLEAAQKLKDKSYQASILRQELSERRARRKIYDQFGLCHSEPRLDRSIKNGRHKIELSVSADDYFESVCELEEGEEDLASENILCEDTFSEDDFVGGKSYTDEYKTAEEPKDNVYKESAKSVVEHLNPYENFFDDIKKMLKVEKNMTQNIHLQLEEVKEHLQCIEKCTELADVKISEEDISHSDHFTEEFKIKDNRTDRKAAKELDSNLLTMWTRLVSFAYQMMQLNHGNLYYDYSFQFLTTILACDIIRRGVSKMCHILQPYVSPIRFTTDESDESDESNVNRKKQFKLVKQKKSLQKKIHSRRESDVVNRKKSDFDRMFRSDECCRRNSRESCRNHLKRKYKRASEPWRRVSKLYTIKREATDKSSSSSSFWPDFSQDDVSRSNNLSSCDQCWRREVENTMLRISRYLNSMLKELEECNKNKKLYLFFLSYRFYL